MKWNTQMMLVAAVSALCLSSFSCDNQASSAQQGQTAATSQAQPTAAAVQRQPQTAEPANVIPEFTFFILKSGIRFTKADLAKTGNQVFILFDPTCSHCQHEAKSIGENFDKVKDANFYFVSMNDPALMSTFLETHAKPLVGQKNVELLYDRNADFINKFHIPSQYPATYVYGSDGQLKDYWNGERDVDKIIASIRK